MKKVLLLLVIFAVGLIVSAQKVSDLPAATTANGADLLMMVQSSASKKITITNFFTDVIINGLTVGDPTSSTLMQIDTIADFNGQALLMNGADSVPVYTPVAYQIDGSTLYTAKHPTITAKTASYTLLIGDDGTFITMNNAGATNFTIPLNSSVAFDIGTQVTLICLGAGSTTVVATGGVATVIGDGKTLVVTVTGIVTLIKIATDTWYVAGDLVAS